MLTSFLGHQYRSTTVQRAFLVDSVEGLGQVCKDRIQTHVLFGTLFLNLSHYKNHVYGTVS